MVLCWPGVRDKYAPFGGRLAYKAAPAAPPRHDLPRASAGAEQTPSLIVLTEIAVHFLMRERQPVVATLCRRH